MRIGESIRDPLRRRVRVSTKSEKIVQLFGRGPFGNETSDRKTTFGRDAAGRFRFLPSESARGGPQFAVGHRFDVGGSGSLLRSDAENGSSIIGKQ